VIKNRLAAIDIGTNSIRGIVVEVDKSGKFRVLDDEKATVRLGEGLARDNAISADAWNRAMEALGRMCKIFEGYGVKATEAVATSAVRKAANGAAFVQAIGETVGLTVNVISGDEEAELAALSVLNNFDMEGIRYAMVDIGGGSVEIVTALGSHIDELYSFELGVVFLTENYLTTDPISPRDIQKMRKHIRTTLKEAFPDRDGALHCLVGSGGTITSMAAMVVAMRKEVYGSVHGSELLRSEVVHLLAMLGRKDLKARRAVPGLNPDRADIIVAGVVLVDELMEFFGVNLLKVNERGIREGLVLKSLRKHGLLPRKAHPRSWRQAVMEFAHSCHFDEKHSLQVAGLALGLFDALAPAVGMTRKDRQVLEAAAILHDVGYFISYASHHKHTYHLIRHAELFGFTPRERELTANVARYHRKSLPKKKHESFARLSPEDQILVCRLGGILRMADGLDRRRTSLIRTLHCTVTPTEFVVNLDGADDISVEMFGARNKGDLFEQIFSRKLVLNAVTDPS
jgi:exopolyphosphatase/guanosine-5'-triphosphate,3'-diphosphate pyrophosphatase